MFKSKYFLLLSIFAANGLYAGGETQEYMERRDTRKKSQEEELKIKSNAVWNQLLDASAGLPLIGHLFSARKPT